MLDSSHFKQIKNQGSIIFKSRFLKNLSKIERYELLQLCHRREYTKGESIYYQDDPGTGMYFIEEGSLELTTESDGKSYTHTLEAPDSFGALSIGYEFRRFSTAKCMSNCVLLGFFKADFETLKKRQPLIAVKFMETLAMLSMRQLSIAIDRLKTKPAEGDIPLQFDAYYDKENHGNNVF
jgi:CRP-like cAMP-binding protein